MIRRGMKKKVLQQKVKSKACPVCGAVGDELCISQGNKTAMKNQHEERV